MQNRYQKTRWGLALAILLAGVGFSTTAAPAEAGPFKEIRKWHEKQRKEQKKYHERQEKYYKKQRKEYREHLEKQHKAARKYGAPIYGAYPPPAVYPQGGGYCAPGYRHHAPAYSSKGFSFGFEYYR